MLDAHVSSNIFVPSTVFGSKEDLVVILWYFVKLLICLPAWICWGSPDVAGPFEILWYFLWGGVDARDLWRNNPSFGRVFVLCWDNFYQSVPEDSFERPPPSVLGALPVDGIIQCNSQSAVKLGLFFVLCATLVVLVIIGCVRCFVVLHLHCWVFDVGRSCLK